MNELMIFKGTDVERFELNGELYFNPKDVRRCLALSEEVLKRVISTLYSDEYVKMTNSDVKDINFRELDPEGEFFLAESGVYNLVFQSQTTEAKKFKKWFAEEALPSILTTGEYFIDEKAKEEYGKNLMARAVKLAEETLKKRDERIKKMRMEHINSLNEKDQ